MSAREEFEHALASAPLPAIEHVAAALADAAEDGGPDCPTCVAAGYVARVLAERLRAEAEHRREHVRAAVDALFSESAGDES